MSFYWLILMAPSGPPLPVLQFEKLNAPLGLSEAGRLWLKCVVKITF